MQDKQIHINQFCIINLTEKIIPTFAVGMTKYPYSIILPPEMHSKITKHLSNSEFKEEDDWISYTFLGGTIYAISMKENVFESVDIKSFIVEYLL